MGLVYARRGRGIFIQQGIHAQCRDKVAAEVVARAFEVCSVARAAGMTAAEIKAVAKVCYGAAVRRMVSRRKRSWSWRREGSRD